MVFFLSLSLSFLHNIVETIFLFNSAYNQHFEACIYGFDCRISHLIRIVSHTRTHIQHKHHNSRKMVNSVYNLRYRINFSQHTKTILISSSFVVFLVSELPRFVSPLFDLIAVVGNDGGNIHFSYRSSMKYVFIALISAAQLKIYTFEILKLQPQTKFFFKSFLFFP